MTDRGTDTVNRYWRGSTRVAAPPARPSRDPVPIGRAVEDVLPFLAAAAARTGTTVPDPRTPATTTCDRCGADAGWHRTVGGRWMLLDPGTWPTGTVPPGRRWRVAGDGTAVNIGGANPTDRCRISHFDVCPVNPPPSDSPLLLGLWRRNAERACPGPAAPAAY